MMSFEPDDDDVDNRRFMASLQQTRFPPPPPLMSGFNVHQRTSIAWDNIQFAPSGDYSGIEEWQLDAASLIAAGLIAYRLRIQYPAAARQPPLSPSWNNVHSTGYFSRECSPTNAANMSPKLRQFPADTVMAASFQVPRYFPPLPPAGASISPSVAQRAPLRLLSAPFIGCYSNFKGTLSAHPIMDFFDTVLRGVGQVFVMNNPLSGAVFLLALMLYSPAAMLFAFVGAFVSTATAIAVRLDYTLTRQGLFTYSGVLSAMGVARSLSNARDLTNSDMIVDVAAASIAAAISTVLSPALARIITDKAGLPVFTFPFQVATWIWLLGRTQFPWFASVILYPDAGGDTGTSFMEIVFRSIGQVFFVDSAMSGMVIVAGMLLCSPLAAAYTIVGTSAAVGLGYLLNISPQLLNTGLWGYNSALTSLCIGGMFVHPRPFFSVLIATVVASCLTCLIYVAMLPVLFRQLTFPFVVVVWFTLLYARSTTWLVVIPLPKLTTVEEHWVLDPSEQT